LVIEISEFSWEINRANNGLPQGSVLARVLFNIYTHDLPETTSQKFVYADDICFATYNKEYGTIEHTLGEDLHRLGHWFIIAYNFRNYLFNYEGFFYFILNSTYTLFQMRIITFRACRLSAMAVPRPTFSHLNQPADPKDNGRPFTINIYNCHYARLQ